MPRLVFVLSCIITGTAQLAYNIFNVKILFQIEILPIMSTQKRKRTDFSLKEKKIIDALNFVSFGLSYMP